MPYYDYLVKGQFLGFRRRIFALPDFEGNSLFFGRDSEFFLFIQALNRYSQDVRALNAHALCEPFQGTQMSIAETELRLLAGWHVLDCT